MSQKVNEELQRLDKRILSRKVLLGEVSEKDLQSFLKKLPDVADNAEEVNPTETKNSFLCLLIPTPFGNERVRF